MRNVRELKILGPAAVFSALAIIGNHDQKACNSDNPEKAWIVECEEDPSVSATAEEINPALEES